MDRRRAAGTLLALAVCISCSTAAPTASNNQTALDVYDGSSEGCYYNFQSYSEGDRIMTNEPCLNCTCHNRMLMCYLRVCPFTKPIGQDCTVEKRADQCCPIVTCPDVPVDLLTSTSTTSPAEYGNTGIGRVDKYGCEINGKYFPEGAKVQSSPNKPCEHCYCIRNMTTCVMQECTLHVEGCTPIYNKDVCCPVRYSCDHPEDEVPLLDDMTTTVRPTPGFLLTTTTLASVTQSSQECVHDDQIFPDGALIKTEKACEHCYCMKGDIVCVVQECGTPMENEGKNCTSVAPREGQCCPDTYICEGDDQTTDVTYETTTLYEPDEATTTPPRRVGIEGSGYRNEDETPTVEPDVEGSGEEPAIDTVMKTEAPEKETEIIDEGFLITKTPHYSSTSTATQEPEVTSEPDKGLNTVPDVAPHEEFTKSPFTNKASEAEEEEKLTTIPIYQTILEQQATTEASLSETTTLVSSKESDSSHTTNIVPEMENVATELTVTTGKSESEIGTTYKPIIDTTTINVVENEIDEGSNMYPSPGRIPGEGDCLLNGITYNNESSVPSTSKCHSSCKCISSIIKCEPILCSPPPEYMDNCQPIYDSPESCCPTYICDHSKETIPPQPHSQMTETESSTTTPDCNGDDCQTSVSQPVECSGSDCQVNTKETTQTPQECSGIECKMPTQEVPTNQNECTDDECKIAVKIPLESTVAKKEPSSATEQPELPLSECSGVNCAEKESPTATESPASLDKELYSTKASDLMPPDTPQKETSSTTESSESERTSAVTELKQENEQSTATEPSETAELTEKELSESECSGDDCKVKDKEFTVTTESSETTFIPIKDSSATTESLVSVELPMGGCSGDDCKDIEKESPASTESSVTPGTLSKEPSAFTESPLPGGIETEKCNGNDCKVIESELPVSTESSEAFKEPNIESSTATEDLVPEHLPTSECSGIDCKVIEKEQPAATESSIPAEIPNEELPVSTESSLPVESPTSECSGDDCQVLEKEPLDTSESPKPTETPKTEPTGVTESQLSTAECNGDDCKIVEKEPSGATESVDILNNEPSASTAVPMETVTSDCSGDECNIIKNEPSPSVTTESPVATNECIGDACKVIEKEPSDVTEPSVPAETLEKEYTSSTKPTFVDKIAATEQSIDTKPGETLQEEPLAITESTASDKTTAKDLSSATETSLPEEATEKKPSAVSEPPEITEVSEIDRVSTTEPSKVNQASKIEPSATTELSSPVESSETEAPSQNPEITDSAKPLEETEREPSITTEPSEYTDTSEKDKSTVPESETTEVSEKEHTTEPSEMNEKPDKELPSVIGAMQPTETITETSETTRYPKPEETSDKVTSIVTESSIPSDNQQSTPAEPLKTSEKEAPATTESSRPEEFTEKEQNSVTDATKQPEVGCDGDDCKIIEKEPVPTVELTSSSSTPSSSSTEYSSPTTELPGTPASECSGDNCKAIETDSTSSTQTTKGVEIPEKELLPATPSPEDVKNEEEASISTETAIPTDDCSDGQCKVSENEPSSASEPFLPTKIPEQEPNIVRESTSTAKTSEEDTSIVTESTQPEKTTADECSGIDCKVIELESHTTTVPSPSTDLPESESSGFGESTKIPIYECSGDDCKLDDKEPSHATESIAIENYTPFSECNSEDCKSVTETPVKPSISENEEPAAQPQPSLPTDEKSGSDCQGAECKVPEKELVTPETPGLSEISPEVGDCSSEGCQIDVKIPSGSTEPSILFTSQSESECSGDQCKTVNKESIPDAEHPDISATKEPPMLSENTSISQCIGEGCKHTENEYVTTETPQDTIEAECEDDHCRRKQTDEASSGTISYSPEDIVTESATDETVTEGISSSRPDDNQVSSGIEVTTAEIMSQDTSSVPESENKNEKSETEKQTERTTQTQAQDNLTSTTYSLTSSEISTEKVPSQKETETEPSTDSVLQEQTTQGSLASQGPVEPLETSTTIPKLEPDSELPDKQGPTTELIETASIATSSPGDIEAITKGASESDKEASQVTEKQESFSSEITPISPIVDNQKPERPTTKEEHFTTTIMSEIEQTEITETPKYPDTEPEKTENVQPEPSVTESSDEKTTLNEGEVITNAVPDQSSTDSDRIGAPDAKAPLTTEFSSTVTSPSVINEVEQEIMENPEETSAVQSVSTTVASIMESEETKLVDKSTPEYHQTEVPELMDVTTKSAEHSEKPTVSVYEQSLENHEAITTESNLMQTIIPEFITKAPESIATESQVRITESSQYPDDKPEESSTISEKESQTETYLTVVTTSPEVLSEAPSSSTESLKQTPLASDESGTEPTALEGISEGTTEQTEIHQEQYTPRQPDSQEVSTEGTFVTNKDENEVKLEEPTTRPAEIDLTTESKATYSETTPYQVELELHTHKTPEETSSPADFEASTAFVLTEQSKEPEYSTDVHYTTQDIVKTTEKSDDSVQQQTEKIPLELPETSSVPPGETELKKTVAPVISTTMAYNTIGSDINDVSVANETVTEAPKVQETEKHVGQEQTTPTSILEEGDSPVTEKVSTERVEELPIPTTPQADKVEEKPLETSTSKPVEMPTDETSEEDSHFPSGPGYGQEPDYVEEDQAFGPGTCRYGGKVYVSAQQIPRDDPCDFCFCFRSDIICLQQSCPPPIHGCHEEPIQGFCCPRYECPVSMATTLNVTTTTTTTTTTLPPHFLPHAYKGAAQRKGCVIKGHTYKVGEVVRASSGPCLHCTCGGDGQMKCDPKVCTPEPMLRQMIAAAVSSKRRR